MDFIGICVRFNIIIYIVTMASTVIAEYMYIRKSEKLFSNSTLLQGRRVTCDNVRPSDGKFASATWTCYNMRVDGLRVRYYYIPGFGAATGCSDGKMIYDSRNDIYALCKHMMLAHGIDRELWAAFVNKASCERSPDERVIFTLQNGIFQWETFSQGKGYILTFRCMAVE